MFVMHELTDVGKVLYDHQRGSTHCETYQKQVQAMI